MEKFIYTFLQNEVFKAAFWSWFIAQAYKFIFNLVRYRQIRWERLIGSGGFPSSHTAFVIAATTMVGLRQGLDADLFAVCLVFSLIVMYDASGVRREAGRQAQIINQLLSHLSKRNISVGVDVPLLKELLGHTPFEVFGGVLLGLAVALYRYFGN